MAVVSCTELADYVIAYCTSKGIEVSNKKLQKLIYYCEAWHLAIQKSSIISNDFEAWTHGAVIRSLYAKYADNGFEAIQMTQESACEIVDKFQIKIPATSFGVVRSVLDKYSRLSAYELEVKNHEEYPWIEAREGLSATAATDRKIDKSSMMEYYSSRALFEEMKTVKCDVFKVSIEALRSAQLRLLQRTLFEKTKETQDAYAQFILDSYTASNVSIIRAEYGKEV